MSVFAKLVVRGFGLQMSPVPKTSVDEDHLPIARQNDVRLAGKRGNMDAKTEPAAMEETSDDLLRPSVFPANLTHYLRAFLLGVDIGCHRRLR